MNEIIFMLGDWPVRAIDAAIGFGALALTLLLAIAVVIARSARRGAELAMAQTIRADELEERLKHLTMVNAGLRAHNQQLEASELEHLCTDPQRVHTLLPPCSVHVLLILLLSAYP